MFIYRKIAAFSFFTNLSKMHFAWSIFFYFANLKYLLFSAFVICTKGNRVMANSGYTNIRFRIKSQLKMLFCHFWYFNFFNFNMTFVKKYIKKLQFFKTKS